MKSCTLAAQNGCPTHPQLLMPLALAQSCSLSVQSHLFISLGAHCNWFANPLWDCKSAVLPGHSWLQTKVSSKLSRQTNRRPWLVVYIITIEAICSLRLYAASWRAVNHCQAGIIAMFPELACRKNMEQTASFHLPFFCSKYERCGSGMHKFKFRLNTVKNSPRG